MKSVIAIKCEQGYVKKIVAELTPCDYLVVSKALRLLTENEEVHELDRKTAKELLDLARKELHGGDNEGLND